MRISIASRFRPFSHVPGEYCLLPASQLGIQAFPALLIIFDLSAPSPKEVVRYRWNVKGPVKDFTVEQDLEKGCIKVWGHASNGFFRYEIVGKEAAHGIKIEKSFSGFCDFPLPQPLGFPIISQERLSLGISKKQDWSLVGRRLEMAEIFPLWLRLGSLTPSLPFACEGTATLLQKTELHKLFMAGFTGLFFPRLEDLSYHGFALNPLQSSFSPLALLSAGSRIIRSLFFVQEESAFHILPDSPHEFHSGRLIHIACENAGEIDIEWRSRKLRRLIFRCSHSGMYRFYFPISLKSVRLKEAAHAKGKRLPSDHLFSFTEGRTYFFDRFET